MKECKNACCPNVTTSYHSLYRIISRILCLCVFLGAGADGHAEGVEAARVRPPLTRSWIREEFRRAKEDPQATGHIVRYLEEEMGMPDREDVTPVVLAYYGAIKGLEGKQALSPAKKLQFLQQCYRWMDEAVSRQPEDLEVRFVRFATLHHIPPFLGSGARRNADLDVIVDLLRQPRPQQIDPATHREMIDFLLSSRRLTAAQRRSLERLLEEAQPKGP